MHEIDITSTTYDQIAGDYAAQWSDNATLAPIATCFAAHLAPGARVLDVGCGPGGDTERLRRLGLAALGIDRSRGMLAQARHRHAFPLVLGDMRHLPLRDGAVDGLWVCASFLHIPKREAPAVLRAFRRVLRPGGVLYIAVKEGDGERWVEYSEGLPRFFAFYQEEDLDGLLATSGFAIRERWLNPDSRGRTHRWINRLAVAAKED